MTSAFFLLFSAAQIIGGVLALRWLARISTPTDIHKVGRTVAQVTMGLMIVAAIAAGIGEVMVMNSPSISNLTSA